MKTMEENKDLSFELEKLFQPTSGEEDILKVATKYTRQISGYQMKILLFLNYVARTISIKSPVKAEALKRFTEDYLEFKQYQNSKQFVMKLFEDLALKKWLGKGVQVDVKK